MKSNIKKLLIVLMLITINIYNKAQVVGTPYILPESINITCTLSSYYRSCNEIKTANPSAPDGVYWIDPDGSATTYSCMQAYCDMTTDGGGWTLVLNYLHKGGTGPLFNIRANSFPLLGSSTLGTDESGTSYWGNLTTNLMNALPFTTLRFYGTTNAHSRVCHFKTSYSNFINYVKTGSGSFSGIQTNFTPMAGHTTKMPADSNWNNPSSTNGWQLIGAQWGYVAGINDSVWELHDGTTWPIKQFEMDYNCDCITYNTLHRVFVK